jgi:hypothetical protein
MGGKILAVSAQAGLAFLAWWMTQPDDERRALQASFWRQLEQLSMNIAKQASNLAAYADGRYQETVRV